MDEIYSEKDGILETFDDLKDKTIKQSPNIFQRIFNEKSKYKPVANTDTLKNPGRNNSLDDVKYGFLKVSPAKHQKSVIFKCILLSLTII